MSDAILVAIIGAIGAIVGGVAPVVVQHLLQNRHKRQMPERQNRHKTRTPERRLNKERSGLFWEAVAALPTAVVALGPTLVAKQLGCSAGIVAVVWFATFFVAMLISTTLLRVKM